MKKSFMLRVICSAIFSCYFLAASAQPIDPKSNQTPTQFPDANAFAKSNLTFKTIESVNHTFGYDIFADGKLLIHQPSIPGMTGNQGFKSKQSAEKVGQLVVDKIKRGEMPPTVTIEEMKKLKAIN